MRCESGPRWDSGARCEMGACCDTGGRWDTGARCESGIASAVTRRDDGGCEMRDGGGCEMRVGAATCTAAGTRMESVSGMGWAAAAFITLATRVYTATHADATEGVNESPRPFCSVQMSAAPTVS